MNNNATNTRHAFGRSGIRKYGLWLLATIVMVGSYACAPSSEMQDQPMPSSMDNRITPKPVEQVDKPSPDPREGLKAGLFDAGEASWNLDMVAQEKPPKEFIGVTNSDLAFKGDYVFQGNYNGFMVWDISDPSNPELVEDYLCPASQSDVSVYGDLLFVSGEGLGGRLDCGTEGIEKQVSQERLRGIRIFDISDVRNPEYISNVQTCRGSHTHSVLDDPQDAENVYVYVSGSAPVRPSEELPGCSQAMPSEDPNSALFRIEVIQVPLDNPKDAKIVNSPRIFENLKPAPSHGLSPADLEDIREAEEQGKFVAEIFGQKRIIPDRYAQQMLQTMVKQRGGSGEPTAADSAKLRENISKIIEERFGGGGDDEARHRLRRNKRWMAARVLRDTSRVARSRQMKVKCWGSEETLSSRLLSGVSTSKTQSYASRCPLTSSVVIVRRHFSQREQFPVRAKLRQQTRRWRWTSGSFAS